MATLTMDDLTVYPVTAELGTNGTVYSKDGNVSVMIPRAALPEGGAGVLGNGYQLDSGFGNDYFLI
jgi:hypothetical protein